MHLGWRMCLSKELWLLHRSSRARADEGYTGLRVVGLRVVGFLLGLRVVGLFVVGLEVGFLVVGLEDGLVVVGIWVAAAVGDSRNVCRGRCWLLGCRCSRRHSRLG